MGSYIQIDSISIDLTNSVDRRDAGKHFSIRGYVSDICKKDWKICWPFPVHESEEQPSRSPQDVPKYRCRCRQNRPQEITVQDIDKDDQTDLDRCSTGCRSNTNSSNAALKSATKQDPMPDTFERRDIDLNTNLSCVSDFLPFSDENVKKAGVLSRRIDLESGLEDNLNHQVTSVSSLKICPGLIQEVHTTKKCCEANGVSDVELVSNHKCMNKSSAEIYNRGTPSADNRCQKELIKGCTVLGKGPTIIEADNLIDHTTGHPPLESVSCNHTVPAVSTDDMVENDFQDHHLEKSTALSRRRPRKVRLMTDLLSENGELKDEQITIQGSPSHGTSNTSAASQAHSIFQGKADTQGGLNFINMGHKGDANTNDTALDIRSKSKDMLAGIGLQHDSKGFWIKSEIERNHIMGKKSRKIQVIDNHLIPEPHQGHQREDEDTVDTPDMAYASKTPSRFVPHPFTGKGMDKFPFHGLRTENKFNLSNGKGKMLQTDGELDSLTCQKNGMLVDNSFAYSGERIMSNMPVPVPIPSAQGSLNGKGLDLSLNSYLAAQVYNNKCIHQIGNQLPVPLPLQEGTSNLHQPIRNGSRTSVFGGPSILSKHITNAISGKGAHCEEITGARKTEKTADAMELGGMKRYSEQTAVSEQGTLDDIPMEIVELLAMNQYERCLPDVENRSSVLDKSTVRRKAHMTVGNTVYSKGELSLTKEGQKERHQGTHKKSSIATRGDNVKPSKRKSGHYFSPFDGNNIGMNNLCSPQFPFGSEVPQSQRIRFSPMDSSHLGSARNCNFNGCEERGSSNAAYQVQGGCCLHKTILQQDDEASRIWANHVSLGYDVAPKKVSHLSRSNMDMPSLHSGALHKQIPKRDIDLNRINLHVAGLEKLDRNTGHGTMNRMNGGYPFPCKHNGMEPHPNLRGSLDMYSNETIPAMHLLSLMDAGMQSCTPFDEAVNAQMLRRPSFHGNCSTKLDIGKSKTHDTQKGPASDISSKNYLSDKLDGCFLSSPTIVASSSTQHDMKFIRAAGFIDRNSIETGKKEKTKSSNSAMQNRVSKQLSWPHLETETPVQHKLEVRGTHGTLLPVRVTLGNSCMVNRNPADFTVPETGNVYMIRGEDLKFEKSIPKKRPRFPAPHGCKQQRDLKGTKMKLHSKH